MSPSLSSSSPMSALSSNPATSSPCTKPTSPTSTPFLACKPAPISWPPSSSYKDTRIYVSPGALASGWPKMASSEVSSNSTSLQLDSSIGSREHLRTVRELPLHIGFGQWRKLDGRWTGWRRYRLPMAERSVPRMNMVRRGHLKSRTTTCTLVGLPNGFSLPASCAAPRTKT